MRKKYYFRWIVYFNFAKMKICLLVIGKTDMKYLRDGIDEYEKRLKRYIPFELKVLPDVKNTKNLSEQVQKEKEAEMILEQLLPNDWVVLLDEKGKQYTSVEYSNYLSQKMLTGIKRLFFIVGGPYGFAESVYQRANEKISLSKMTFSHQMVRMIFVEQIYRAMTILKGEPYHHE